jgi:hypothetical protein
VDEMSFTGVMPVGIPKRTWKETVQMDIDVLRIVEELAMDRAAWRSVIASPTPSKNEKIDYKQI